ncbi:hypothetical protein [Rheinheimera baltica]|uniref:hypothetical protein n=1 Tax=Rheinheimera baltica TaxID=67576 RepID=UPI0003F7BE9C|nr:hypothetical protein [Rheinheimera baltica]
MTSVLNDAGFTAIFELYSIQRGLAALQGDIDFTTIVAPSAALQSEFVLSKLPVYLIKLGVLRLSTTEKLADLSSLQQHDYVSLRATEFAYLPDTFALPTEFFAKQYKVDSLDDALRLIAHERYAYFLSYYLSRQELKYPFLVFDELLTLPVYLAMSKAHPKMEEMMLRIDTAMAKR